MFVKIEAITNGNKKFLSEIETDGLYTLNCSSGVKIELLDKICQICISNDVVLIRTEDRDFRNGCQCAQFIKDDRLENNVVAFDLQGNKLWNIGEIVGDIKMAFDSITHITSADAEREFGIKTDATHNLFKCICAGFVYIIDANDRKSLLKLSGKVR